MFLRQLKPSPKTRTFPGKEWETHHKNRCARIESRQEDLQGIYEIENHLELCLVLTVSFECQWMRALFGIGCSKNITSMQFLIWVIEDLKVEVGGRKLPKCFIRTPAWKKRLLKAGSRYVYPWERTIHLLIDLAGRLFRIGHILDYGAV